MTAASGDQVTIEHGTASATIATVGASLRTYTVAGVDVVAPYPAERIAPAYSGKVLAPWPNRLRDGSYELDGEAYQVPLSEPDRATALHGLVAFDPFTVVEAGPAQVTLEHSLVPTPGYPWPVQLSVTYRLDDDGLTVLTQACDPSGAGAPFGVGFHPWLAPGGDLDTCTLAVDVATHVTVDDRLLPTGAEPADPALLAGLPLAGADLDDAWTAAHGADGRTTAVLTRADGRRALIWGDASVAAWQVCTGDHVPAIARSAVAVEPMTCVADAFRTGEHLVRLDATTPARTVWGLSLL